MNASKHRKLDTEIISLYNIGLSPYDIADKFGLDPNTIRYRLVVNGVKMRSRSESLVGRPKSIEHNMKISLLRRLSGVAKGSRNPNWKGGVSSEYDKKMSAVKRDPKYKAWRRIVVSIGFCKSCGSKTGLQAHHVLPKIKFPNLIHDIDNGICLCRSCHKRLHSKRANFVSARIAGNSYRKDEDNPQPSQETGRFNDYVRTSKEKI